MKLFLSSLLLIACSTAFAQPKMISTAVISTTTNVIAPEDEDVSQIQNQGGGGGFNMRNFGDGETKTTTYLKDDKVKTSFKSESFRGNVFRDNTAKTTILIFEVMGNKQGIISSDADADLMRKNMDSMMKARAQSDTTMAQRRRPAEASKAIVAYTEETKKIAGYNCKKAFIVTDRLLGKDSQAVWYTPEIKFPNLSSTGGTSGMSVMTGGFGGTNNFEKLDGFVMQYERDMPRGRKMEVKVTKIETDKEIAQKEFDVPKDVELKTMKEMSQGGGFRMMGRP